MSTAAEPSKAGRLKRELSIFDAAAFSIGLIGPVGAMAVNGVGAAGLLGTGATWAFLFALLGVILVAYGFIHLSRYISHTGSVYGLVGVTLGPRTGFVAGVALAFAYMTIGAGSTIAIGLFLEQVLQDLGLASNPDWLIIALVALVAVAVLSVTEIRVVTKTLLAVELLGICLAMFLAVAILGQLGFGGGPAGQQLSWEFMSLPTGVDFQLVGTAAVFGFLAFAGFEGAASLGEETTDPKRQVPRAIVIAIVIVAIFYLTSVVAQSLGYGTSQAGVKAFQNTESAYGELAKLYVGKPLAIALNAAAALSSLAITIGTMNASARIIYACGRGAGDQRVTTRLSRKGEPVAALALAIGAAALIMIGQRLAGTTILDAVLYWLTIGTLSLLVAYALATLGAMRFLFFQGPSRLPRWQVVIPIGALAFILYVLYRNTVGVASPYDRFPYLVMGVLVLAAIVAAVVPGLADRVRATLADEVGSIEPTPATDPSPTATTRSES